jgi:cytochrome c oxidase assembly factor CtaG
VPATLPAAFLTFADYPMYRLYEFAPRVHPMLTPANDHQTAGLVMKVIGDPVIWIGLTVVFFRWANAERRKDLQPGRRLPGTAARM